MDIASLIIANIIPLYILVGLGFIAGKWLDVNLHSMAIIAIYILAPVVNFGAMAKMEFTTEYIALPIAVFICSAIIGTLSYKTAQAAWKNNHANLIGMGSVAGNTMYFGLPVVMALLGPKWVGVYALMNLGTFLNEIGLGYFFGARGHATVKGALIKIAKFPVIHAIWLGLLFNIFDIKLPDAALRYWDFAIGSWVFIGMMLIGVALSKQPKLELDIKLSASLFIPKFIIWPCAGFALVIADLNIFQLFPAAVHQMLLVLSTVPLAGNLVAYATTLHLHPEKAASTVLISTIIATATVPAAIALYTFIAP